jgi:hypothetical protein
MKISCYVSLLSVRPSSFFRRCHIPPSLLLIFLFNNIHQIQKHIFMMNQQCLNFLDLSTLRGQDQRHDQAIQGKGFSENQYQNHPHKNLVLLRVCSHTCVSHDTDGQSCSLKLIYIYQWTESAAQAWCQMGVGGVGLVASCRDLYKMEMYFFAQW